MQPIIVNYANIHAVLFLCCRFAEALKSPTEPAPGMRCEVELRSRPSSRPPPPSKPVNQVAPAATGERWEQGELLLLMYVLGGREVGQVTVFKRPLSVWKLDLTKI